MRAFRSWCWVGLSVSGVVGMSLLPRQVEAQQPTTAAVRGIVTDSLGRPMAGADVQVVHSLLESNGEVRTGADGRFLIGNLQSGGPYVIAARKIGFRPVALYEVQLKAGDTSQVTLRLVRPTATLDKVQIEAAPKGSALASMAITAEEIEKNPVPSAFDVINRDRPTWWRGGLRECPAPNKVYINGIRRDRPGEGIEYTLYDIPASDIQEMRLADCHANIPIDRQNAIYIVTKPGLSGLR